MENINTEIGSFFKNGREYTRETVRFPRLTFKLNGEVKSKDFGALDVEGARKLASNVRAGELTNVEFVSLKWVEKMIETETETSMEQRGS